MGYYFFRPIGLTVLLNPFVGWLAKLVYNLNRLADPGMGKSSIRYNQV